MLQNNAKQATFYSTLYEKIPKNHILRRINETVDFSFVNELLSERYCKDFGRPAKEPEMMMKLLFLQYLYNLSDVKVIEEANVNLAFLYFLGLNPEDALPDASLLAKFRTQRLPESSLDDTITEIVKQCVDKGIIKSSSVSIDATHIGANSTKKVPERVMKHLAKKIFKGLEADKGSIPCKINTQIPDYTQIDDPKEAKAVMKEYLEEVIAQSKPYAGKKTKKAIAEAEEILSDEKFIAQKGVRSLSDTDARVGYKSKTDSFFGYKDEFVMTTDERIITAVDVYSGEHVDGSDFNSLMDRSKKSGMIIDEVYGDKAYFKASIFEKLEDMNAEGYIPVNACSYQINEDIFSYNKDSDQWICFMGNRTVSKKRFTENRAGGPKDFYRYIFEEQACIECEHRAECMGKSTTKARRLVIGLSTPLFYEISQKQKEAEFLMKYKKRASIEWKNGEMKRFHGLGRARGWGIKSVAAQAKLTAIAVNLKRIAAIVTVQDSKSNSLSSLLQLISRQVPLLKRRCRDMLEIIIYFDFRVGFSETVSGLV
jgi:transposase/curved DNA-binding protein CbpA